MTQKEIIQELKKGKKVTHRFFLADEYIYTIGNDLFTEDGSKVREGMQFFTNRNSEAWNKDWKILEDIC